MYKPITPPSVECLERKESKQLIKNFNRQRTQSDLMDDVAIMGKKTTKINLTTTSAKWVVDSSEFTR